MANSNDCTPCRLVSGFGCIGIGIYIGIVGTKQSQGPYSRVVITLIGAGFAGVGIARLLGLRPFSSKKKTDEKS